MATVQEASYTEPPDLARRRAGKHCLPLPRTEWHCLVKTEIRDPKDSPSRRVIGNEPNSGAGYAALNGYRFGACQWMIQWHAREEPEPERVLLALVDRLPNGSPAYAKIECTAAVDRRPWSIEDDLMTPTVKLRRRRLLAQFQGRVAAPY